MTRTPLQVLVYPFRNTVKSEFEYALLKRADAGYWQAIAGGGENGETPIEAAKREVCEEAGLPRDSVFIRLITVLPIPVSAFKDGSLWDRSICVIPQYCFGVLAADRQIILSREHTDLKWLKYEDACCLMKYEGNKIALWELNERLKVNPNSLFPL